MGAWGLGGWGTSGWGGPGAGDGLEVVDARAVRENVVRVEFNQPPYFSSLLDPSDASSPERFAVTPVAGVAGDGLPTRPVTPASVERALFAGAGGRFLDLAVDRPFSPFPGAYVVAVNNLVVEATGALLLPGKTSRRFPSLYRGRVPHRPDLAIGRTDFANPSTTRDLDGLADGTPLGTFAVDASGDYAADRGMASYRKRVLRRLMTKRGRFAHLPNYGVGVPDNVKQLARAGLREEIADDAEKQIKLEPETDSAAVTVVPDADRPSLLHLRVRAVTRDGHTLDLSVPLLVGG